jgi:signal transduction histidine kinase
VSEALTNSAKYANASFVSVCVEGDDVSVRVSVSDDGVGGAKPGVGSGLIGLRDRVEALGGKLNITSPPGSGTTLVATMPIGTATTPAH